MIFFAFIFTVMSPHTGDGQYQFCPGNGTRETSQGMEAVFQRLLHDSVPPECLHVHKAVKAIRWTGGGGPTIETVMETFSSVDEVDESTNGEKRTKYGINNNVITRKHLEEETAGLNDVNRKRSDQSKIYIEKMENRINLQEDQKGVDGTQQGETFDPDGVFCEKTDL